MPRPRIHKGSRQKQHKEGARPDPTAKERMRFWREAKSHGMTSTQYRAFLEAGFARRRAQHERYRAVFGFDLLDRFAELTGRIVTDYETTRASWKRYAAAIHPDRTGNHEAAAEFNSLWEKIKSLKGWK